MAQQRLDNSLEALVNLLYLVRLSIAASPARKIGQSFW
jgi:hypothetical protein